MKTITHTRLKKIPLSSLKEMLIQDQKGGHISGLSTKALAKELNLFRMNLKLAHTLDEVLEALYKQGFDYSDAIVYLLDVLIDWKK